MTVKNNDAGFVTKPCPLVAVAVSEGLQFKSMKNVSDPVGATDEGFVAAVIKKKGTDWERNSNTKVK
jgi:hypothetical protein